MKTIKLFSKLIAILAISFSLYACSDNDNDHTEDYNKANIIGSWGYEEEDYYEVVTFEENGTLSVSSIEYYEGEWDEESETGRYSIEGNQLTATIYGRNSTSTILTLTSKRLVIEDEEGEKYTYTRIL